jgi:hypothetical protein
LTKNDIYSHIHLMYIQLAKESIEYKVVSGHCMTTKQNIEQLQHDNKYRR